eukprot:6193919-Pleurochrysis_carterae.AAC.4
MRAGEGRHSYIGVYMRRPTSGAHSLPGLTQRGGCITRHFGKRERAGVSGVKAAVHIGRRIIRGRNGSMRGRASSVDGERARGVGVGNLSKQAVAASKT